MAREILFKAKRLLDDEWVEGDLIQGGYDFIVGIRHLEGTYGYVHEVDPNTICQYTGLCDKNGNKIWENDVVKQYYTDWRTKFDYCVIESIKYVEDEARFVTYDEKENKAYFLNKHSVYEVIGTIFDHPELLGGEDNG